MKISNPGQKWSGVVICYFLACVNLFLSLSRLLLAKSHELNAEVVWSGGPDR